MFGKAFDLFEILGIKVRADASWLVLVVLITWSLATGLFPSFYEGLSERAYWTMGIVATAGLFASLIVHELSHSVVALRYGLPIKGIRLFIFGGVAEMEEEPKSAETEIKIAIAGPIASFALSGGFYAIGRIAQGLGAAEAFLGVLYYLAFINCLLAGFNLVPAFPLDGGRVFRALLWRWKGDVQEATRLASASGEIFSFAMMLLGILNILGGNFVGGLWWFLIGMFLRDASKSSYVRMLSKKAFEGEPVRRFMTADPITVPPDTSLQALIEDYFFRHHHSLFPVCEDGRLLGYVTVKQVKEAPHKLRGFQSVGDIMVAAGPDVVIAPDTDALEALTKMQKAGNSRLLVVEGGHLVGLISLKDLMAFFNMKLELEDFR